MVKRGPGPNTLDTALLRQAMELGGDWVKHLGAAFLGIECAFQRFHLATDAAHAPQQFGFLAESVTHMACAYQNSMVGRYSYGYPTAERLLCGFQWPGAWLR